MGGQQRFTIAVTLSAGALTLNVPGQNPYPMTAQSKTRFKLENAPEGCFAEFTLDQGQPKSVTIESGSPDRKTVLPYKGQ